MSQRDEPEGRGQWVFQPGLALFILVFPSNKYRLFLRMLVSCLSSPLGCELTRTEELMAFFPTEVLTKLQEETGILVPK